MTNFYATPDNVATTTPGYVAGSGSLAVATGAGASFGTTFPGIVSTFLADGTPKARYSYSGRTADTLTGLVLIGGTDTTLAAGSLVEVRWTAESVLQIAGAINALETAEMGDVLTSGSYADPAWITSLAGSKVLGNIGGNAGSITGAIVESQVTGLVTDLAGKAATSHTHAAADLVSGTLAVARGGLNTGAITGLVKGSGTAYAAAVAGTDYYAPGAAIQAADVPAIPESRVTSLVADLALKAPLASPTFTGTPAAPTPAGADNSTAVATTAFVKGQGYSTTTGTVTSVGLTVPGVLFSVSGSPITTTGTIAFALLTQTANTVLAGPTSGSAAAPTMRALVAADMPAAVVQAITLNTSGLIHTTPVTATVSGGVATLTMALATQAANIGLFGPPSGGAVAPTFRALVAADIPALAATILTSGTLADGRLSANVPLLNAANTFTNTIKQTNAGYGFQFNGYDTGTRLYIASDGPTTVPQRIKLMVNQTGDARQNVSSVGSVLYAEDKLGRPYTGGTVPTVAVAGTGAGTSPTLSVAGTDVNGVITITTGTGPTASATVATLTFSATYAAAPKTVILTPADGGGGNAQILSGQAKVGVAASSITTTKFDLTVGTTPLAATTTYKFFYQVLG